MADCIICLRKRWLRITKQSTESAERQLDFIMVINLPHFHSNVGIISQDISTRLICGFQQRARLLMEATGEISRKYLLDFFIKAPCPSPRQRHRHKILICMNIHSMSRNRWNARIHLHSGHIASLKFKMKVTSY